MYLDEALHLSFTQTVINLWKSGLEGEEWKAIAEACHDESIEIFRSAVQQEKEWGVYLFQYGPMVGLNIDVYNKYIEYVTNQRMKAVGLEPLFPNVTSNPVPWINNWLSSDHVQVAPQETEITSYLINAVDSNVNEDDLDDLKL